MITATDAAAEADSRLTRLRARPEPALAGVVVVFVAIHLARIGRVEEQGVNTAGYLENAVRLAHGHLARSHYSPGFGFLLTPVAWLTGGQWHVTYLTGAVLNVGVSVAAILTLYAFLRVRTSPWTALALTAVFALGETATNTLFGVEVEPLALLLVAATLLWLERERPWLACLATVAAVVCRVPLGPFFVVLWLFQLRRRLWPALAAGVGMAAGLAAHLATQTTLDQSYAGIAADTYRTTPSGQGPIARAAHLVPGNLWVYTRLAIPAVTWPVALLHVPVAGWGLGLVTCAVVAVGAWRLLQDPRTRAPVVGTAVYLGLLLAWPISPVDAIRMCVPVAPMILLAAVTGLTTVAHALRRRWGAPMIRRGTALLVAGALVASVIPSLALAALRAHSTQEEQAFIALNREAASQMPPGRVLSHSFAMVALVTGRDAVDFPKTGVTADVRWAQQVRACTLELDPFSDSHEMAALHRWVDGGGARVLAVRRSTSIVVLNEPWCPPAPAR